MSEISPQRISEFMRIIFVRLWTEPTGLSSADILAQIPQAARLSGAEQEYIPNTHIPSYERAVRLASIPFEKAGWLEKCKGRWHITEAGKRACKSFSSAEAFSQEAARIMGTWRESRSQLSLISEDAQEKAWDQLRSYLQGLQPYEFRNLVGDLLKAMGFHITWVAPPEKERGIVSFIMYADALGLSQPRIKVHVLHTGQPVMFEGLKAFTSVLGSGDAGLFISSGGFTASVLEEAVEQRIYRITLIDLGNFADLWLEYYDKLSEDARRIFPLMPVYFLASSD